MSTALDSLRERLHEIEDLSGAAALLRWDQQTYMPPRGAAARGRQTALLSRLAHERLTDAETGRLLERAAAETAALPADHDDAALVRVTRRAFEQAVRIPSSLVSEFNEHSAESYQVWTAARPANDFARVRPCSRRRSTCRAAWRTAFPDTRASPTR